MKLRLDTETIQNINFFQNLTGSSIRDCIAEGDEIYFIVADGQYGLCVGKGGEKIKNAERIFKKTIKIFEYSPNIEKFVRNLVPETQEIMIKETTIEIRVRQSDRAKIIGRGGKNIKIFNRFLKRLFNIDNLKIK